MSMELTTEELVRQLRELSKSKSSAIRVRLDRFTNDAGAAHVLGVSERTLREWRKQSTDTAQPIGPDWFNIGKGVQYEIHELVDYIRRSRGSQKRLAERGN